MWLITISISTPSANIAAVLAILFTETICEQAVNTNADQVMKMAATRQGTGPSMRVVPWPDVSLYRVVGLQVGVNPREVVVLYKHRK